MDTEDRTTGRDGETTGLSRRQLLAGSAVVGAVAGAGLVSGRAPSVSAATKPPTGTGGTRVFMRISGSKTQFLGESLDQKGKTEVFSFSYGVSLPYDKASGLPTGRRQHKPIEFRKEVGSMSPQLFAALITNELLPAVQFELFRSDLIFRVKLTNAHLVNDAVSGIQHTNPDDTHELESIAMTFEKIEIQDKDGKTMALDDWTSSPS